MSKINIIITVSLFLVLLLLGAYTHVLRKHIDDQSVRIAKLESNYIGSKNMINSNAERISYYVDMIERLDADYSAQKELEDEPSYIQYKEKIESILDKKISDIVTDKPFSEGKWFVSKVRFIGPEFALVYYEDGHDLFSTLVQITKTGDGYSFRNIE